MTPIDETDVALLRAKKEQKIPKTAGNLLES